MLSLIAAIDSKNGIGKNNRLPWKLPQDLKRFKSLTVGNVVIMGRKTFESIGKVLPNRINIVVTKNPDFETEFENLIIASSVEIALQKAQEFENKEIFVIGGQSIYEQTVDLADKLYLTLIDGDFGCDTFFPEYKHLFNNIIYESKHRENDLLYDFIDLERR